MTRTRKPPRNARPYTLYKPGDVVGKLTLIRPVEADVAPSQLAWECVCSCGRTHRARASSLGHPEGTRSCGKCGRTLKIAGRKFGDLTAVAPTKRRQHESIVWECVCDKGHVSYLSAARLCKDEDLPCRKCHPVIPGRLPLGRFDGE